MLLGSGLTICIGMAIVISILRKQIVKKNEEIESLEDNIEDLQNQLELAGTNKDLEIAELKAKITYLEGLQLENAKEQAEEIKTSEKPIANINDIVNQFNKSRKNTENSTN